jgi:cell wall-associated NlpC family hydrolase
MTARERFLIHLAGYIRIPYVWAGSSMKTGLDCSGFAQLALNFLKLDPPGDQTAHALAMHFLDHGILIACVVDSDLGDLLFFGKDGKVTHVAIALGDGLMIEAGGGGSTTTSVEIARAQGAEVRIVSVLRRSDLLYVIRPHGLPWSST